VLGPGNVSTVDTQSNRISGSVNLGPPGTDPFDIAVTPTVTVGDSPYGIAVSP